MGTYIRTATALVRVNTGPPTWWKPNGSITRTPGGPVIIRVGWLRLALEVGLGTARHSETT